MPARDRPAVFLDRDGVINEDGINYIKSWAEFRLYPGVLEALRLLREAGCEVYLVTNQAGVGRGVFPLRNLRDILIRLRLQVSSAGGLIHGVAFCPHTTDDGCVCRKPQPGMLRKLAFKYGLDLLRSVMVGDSCHDMTAAQAVGCKTVLLTTREPDSLAEHFSRCERPPDYRYPNLLSAVPCLVELAGPSSQPCN